MSQKFAIIVLVAALGFAMRAGAGTKTVDFGTITGAEIGAATQYLINPVILKRHLESRCVEGYEFKGHGTQCSGWLNGPDAPSIDTCVGEGATEAWWSCVLDPEVATCPAGGKRVVRVNGFNCVFPKGTSFNPVCPDAFYRETKLCNAGSTGFCCRADAGDPCGSGSTLERILSTENCCVIYKEGPC